MHNNICVESDRTPLSRMKVKNIFLTEHLEITASCEFGEVFENTLSIEYLWETAHFMYNM